MSRSSGRAQVDPFVALAAVFALTVGLVLSAVATDGYLDRRIGYAGQDSAKTLAHQTADRVADTSRLDGAVRPGHLPNAVDSGPAGYRVNATLQTRTSRWTAGPAVPEAAVRVERRVSVSLGPGRVRPGVLRVGVWR